MDFPRELVTAERRPPGTVNLRKVEGPKSCRMSTGHGRVHRSGLTAKRVVLGSSGVAGRTAAPSREA